MNIAALLAASPFPVLSAAALLAVVATWKIRRARKARARSNPDYRPPKTWEVYAEPPVEALRAWFLAAGENVQREWLEHWQECERDRSECFLRNHRDQADQAHLLRDRLALANAELEELRPLAKFRHLADDAPLPLTASRLLRAERLDVTSLVTPPPPRDTDLIVIAGV